jgi:hypothetical protein
LITFWVIGEKQSETEREEGGSDYAVCRGERDYISPAKAGMAVTRAFPEYDGMVVTWISSCILRCETVLISAEIE